MNAVLEYLPTIRKALVGGAVALVVGYLTKHGVNVEVGTQDAFKAVLDFVLGFVFVWLIPNKSAK